MQHALEYREPIRDGREVWINGERVRDVTQHPMFRPIVDIRARMYDMQHDERLRPALVTRKDRTGVAHQRIRKFNTRDTYPEQKLSNDLAQAVVANNIVFLRGQVGQNLDTSESVGIGDVAAQTEQAMENIRTLLEEAGSCLDHVCKITIYLVDVRYREAVYNVVGKWLKGVHPVSTGVVVSALARPEWLVEIDAIDVIPGTDTSG